MVPEISQAVTMRIRGLLPQTQPGAIPPELGQLSSLEGLDLSWNQLQGRWSSGAV